MSTGPVTILIAEDDPFVRETIVPELEHAGYAVVEAEDGKAALAFLEAGHRVDLLFTDIGCPGWTAGTLPMRHGLCVPVFR